MSPLCSACTIEEYLTPCCLLTGRFKCTRIVFFLKLYPRSNMKHVKGEGPDTSSALRLVSESKQEPEFIATLVFPNCVSKVRTRKSIQK